MKSFLERLMRHVRWADQRALVSLRQSRATPPEAVRLFAHLVTADRIYLSRARSEDPFPQDFWPDLTLDKAARTAADVGDALIELVRRATDVQLDRPVRYRNSKGDYFETPLQQLLTHVALHGEHHRGQIARIIRASNGTPAETDFITFVRDEDPGQRVHP